MEEWNRVKARGTRSRSMLALQLFVLLVVGIEFNALVVQPMLHRHDPAPAAGDPRAAELAHLKSLGRALKLHADEHEGRFPPSIAEIEWRPNKPGMEWAGLPAAVSRFHNPDTGEVSDWLYYKGHTENDPPETILAASPVPLGKRRDRRMVVRVNGVAETIAEADFLRPLAEEAGR